MTRPAEILLSEGLLLAELNHRVANTFQIVGSLLAREAAASVHREAADVLLKADAQLQAFALLHEALRHGGPAGGAPATLCACDFLVRLCEHLEMACLKARGLTLTVRALGTMPLREQTCRGLGLIVTELVLNAVKHAFRDREGGRIEVALRRGALPGEAVLCVQDDGLGMAVLYAAPGRGLGFVDILARSIGGASTCRTGSAGTCTTVTFRELPV